MLCVEIAFWVEDTMKIRFSRKNIFATKAQRHKGKTSFFICVAEKKLRGFVALWLRGFVTGKVDYFFMPCYHLWLIISEEI
jgi:hypothetical protein